MPREYNQKIKLLRLMELLRLKTDREHPLTTRRICGLLQEDGISCDRRTLTRDIAALEANGYHVSSRMLGHEKAYYVEDAHLSQADLNIIEGALRAAPFLDEKRTEAIIGRLACLGDGEKLPGKGRVTYFVQKTRSGRVYESVRAAQEAICSGGLLEFSYEDHPPLENAPRVRRVCRPAALLFRDGFYFIVCEDEAGKPDVFRADRMADARPAGGKEPGQDRGDTLGQALDSFFGPETECVLRFEKDLIWAVTDRFGWHINIEETDCGRYAARLKARTDAGFWGWLFSFSGRMQIISPRDLAAKYMTWCSVIAQSIAESMLEENDVEK